MVEAIQPVFVKYPGIKQFIKFCIIGATSTLIDFAILNLLNRHFGMEPIRASCISFCFAVTNGYIWNSRWTFRGIGSGKHHERFAKFIAVNLVGLSLNTMIMKTMLCVFTGTLTHPGPYSSLHVNGAKAIAVVFVSVWNFFASRKWAFT